MRIARHSRLAAVLAALSLLVTACGGDGDPATDATGTAGAPTGGPTITIGTANFTENVILGHIYQQVLEANGYPTELTANIGSREVIFPSLVSGELDLIPEYTGNALRFARDGEEPVELRDEQEVYRALQEAVSGDDLVALQPSQAQDVDGLAVTQETAQEHNLEQISDIADFPGTFRFGAGPECVDRASCLQGYRQIYGFSEEQFEFVELDVAGPITVQALNSGEVDGANLFTTQGVVAANDFVLLEDDQDMQLPQQIVPITRQEVIDAYGQDLRTLLNEVTGTLTTEGLTELNRQASIDQEDPEEIARGWLRDNGFLEG